MAFVLSLYFHLCVCVRFWSAYEFFMSLGVLNYNSLLMKRCSAQVINNDKNGQRMTANSITFILICLCANWHRHNKQMFAMKSYFDFGCHSYSFVVLPCLASHPIVGAKQFFLLVEIAFTSGFLSLCFHFVHLLWLNQPMCAGLSFIGIRLSILLVQLRIFIRHLIREVWLVNDGN